MRFGVQISVDARRLPADADHHLHPFILEAAGVRPDDLLDYVIEKRSLDARKKPCVRLLYLLTVHVRDGARPQGAVTPPLERLLPPIPENRSGIRNPIVVGAGPAGLFAALTLAEAGAAPVILERGRDVETRQADIRHFFTVRELNPESNLLFGEGGAGTWSDGKLFTRVKDPRSHRVLKTFVECGAQPEILYFAHPHIGSDRLPGVIAALRRRIIRLGGQFLWGARAAEILGEHSFRGIRLSSGEFLEASHALIACGHSARELILHLTGRLSFQMKGFQLGCRIEHPQAWVNHQQYGMDPPCPSLGAAEYLFSVADTEKCRGATTFCMCPGGEIIPATSKEGTLCSNGMSQSRRDGRFANSAIITTLPPGTFTTPAEAFQFLDALEGNVFREGGQDYAMPVQTAADFLAGRSGHAFAGSSYRLGIRPARLDRIVPPAIALPLANAIRRFDAIAPGFARNGMLVGMETRVSSPVRFLRNPETLASSLDGLYLAGEGAGAAGGIMSAAIDGIRLAEKMLGM